jgi:predicted dehydrogenase
MLTVGVIGVGHLGSRHASLWKDVADAELVGVYDEDAERAEAIARDLGVMLFRSFDEAIDIVDAVSLVTPTSTHAELGARVLGAGVHCFIEKPITARYAEAAPLAALAKERGLVLQVGHVERFNPAFLALEGQKIAPMFIESHRLAQFKPRATDVAVVLDLMIHDIDLALKLVNSPVAEVRASGVSVVSDTIDIANARVEFANGCVANLTASRISQRPMRKMRLFQQDSYISIDFAKPSLEIFSIADADADDTGNGAGNGATALLGAIDLGTKRRAIGYAQPPLPPVNALARELEMFAHAINTGTPAAVTAEEGAEALRVAEMILEEIGRARLPVT